MRTLFALVAVVVFTPAAWAGVWVAARYYDEKTPLEAVNPNYPTVYRDIMVGTHLTIVISADRGGYWSGQLNMDWDSNVRNCVPGDWFILDYRARQVGTCDLALTESDPETGARTLLQTLSFTHVPSRDFNADTLVNFRDFAKLASRWQSELDADPNHPDAAMDLDADRTIDVNDLALFSGFWLERTAAPEPPADPNVV